MKSPYFSIVIPCYGADDCFGRATGSVLNQSFSDTELILVDDCSPGNIPDLCDGLAQKDKRVRVIHRTENGGISAATNDGIDIATGEYITFLDSDDYFEDDVFQKVYDRISECTADDNTVPVDILQCNNRTMQLRETGEKLWEGTRAATDYPLRKEREDKCEYALKRCLAKQLNFFNASRFARLEFIRKENLRFNPRYDSSQDFDFTLRAYMCAQRIEHCDILSYSRVYREGSVSQEMSASALLGRLNMFADWFDYVEKLDIKRGIKKAFLASMANKMYKVWKQAAAGKKCKPDINKSLVWSAPGNQEKYIRFIPVMPPIPVNPVKWRKCIKESKGAMQRRRQKRMMIKEGVPAVFGTSKEKQVHI